MRLNRERDDAMEKGDEEQVRALTKRLEDLEAYEDRESRRVLSNRSLGIAALNASNQRSTMEAIERVTQAQKQAALSGQSGPSAEELMEADPFSRRLTRPAMAWNEGEEEEEEQKTKQEDVKPKIKAEDVKPKTKEEDVKPKLKQEATLSAPTPMPSPSPPPSGSPSPSPSPPPAPSTLDIGSLVSSLPQHLIVDTPAAPPISSSLSYGSAFPAPYPSFYAAFGSTCRFLTPSDTAATMLRRAHEAVPIHINIDAPPAPRQLSPSPDQPVPEGVTTVNSVKEYFANYNQQAQGEDMVM